MKKSLNVNSPHSKGNETEGTDFAQLFPMLCKKAIHTAFKKAIKVESIEIEVIKVTVTPTTLSDILGWIALGTR